MTPRPLVLAVTLALLAGCTVGPDYHGAPVVAEKTLAAGRLPHADPAAASVPAAADWWRGLGDSQLDTLVEAALKDSPDIQTAQARLRQARAGLSSEQAAGRPKVSTNLTAVRLRSPDLSQLTGGDSGGGRGPLQLYLADFDASWELDLFGGTRRAIEAASASAQASSAQLADTQVQLAADVVQAYVSLRDQQARLALVNASADLEAQVVDLTRQRRGRGVASQLQLEQVTTQWQTTQAQRLPLQADIIESLDQLAVLCNLEPGALDSRLAQPADLPKVPASVPVADPAALLKARPDIRAAERQLASSNAQIGEKKADWFPKLSLMGDLGFSAGDPSHLARKDNGTWLLIPRLSWNALDFGRVAASIDSAEGGRDEAQAHYRSVVLGALRDADSALARYGHQRENVVLLRDIEASSGRAASLTRERYDAGTASTLDWLDAERTRFDAEQNRISGDAQLLKDFASLHKALGLGWRPVNG
ncbi:MAG: efflux transporter outer membrane subunit [Pseudomonas sp.]|uniref:efflux transporter outer membrane subunit n=1 Tax=Pseudomonas abieticivorans TaxID=2931382 RepID=UPI0020BD757F|nr:efflux transporter outer membrane subunit [Pseudomonas sp. PIA16]MDE1164670.1 efflux transporter outer membrane subunit [Pseudomonas sp.]